jgi:ABC-type antimicrobial peptide transport system permease subunit
VILGVPAALAVGRLLQNTFVRTEARNVGILIVTVALLAIVALVTSIVPAWRATRLQPSHCGSNNHVCRGATGFRGTLCS